MSFELDTRGADELDALARSNGVPLGTVPEPGFLSGSLTAPVKGLARGLVGKPALLLGDAATPVLRPAAQSVDKALGSKLDSWLTEQQRRNVTTLDDLRPDPATTGFAGNVISGLFDLGSSAVLYSPSGAAVLEGYARKQELVAKGVDETTATGVGAVTGAATLVGIKAPLTLGTSAVGQGARVIAGNAAYGAGVSAATGIAERGASRELLQRNGYADQAALLDPFDKTALIADLVLGSAFSGAASLLGHRASVRSQEATEAAHAVQSAKHAAIDSAPGIPADTRSLASHQRAMAQAFDQVLAGERVNVGDTLADTTFVRDSSAETRARAAQAHAEMRLHVADILANARAMDIEPARADTALAAADARPQLDPAPAAPASQQVVRNEPAQARVEPASDPVVRAATEVAAVRPDMRVVLEDGTPLTARDAVERVQAERVAIKQESAAFEAAVNCLLRN